MAFSEADLIRRAQAGDQDAFVELYEANYVSVYNYAYYRVHDAAIAGDIAAEVFARMVEKIDRFTYSSKPDFGLALHHCPQSGHRLPAAATATRCGTDIRPFGLQGAWSVGNGRLFIDPPGFEWRHSTFN